MKVSPTRLHLNLNGLQEQGMLPTVKQVVVHFFLGPPDPQRKRRRPREPQPASSHGSEEGLWYIDTVPDPPSTPPTCEPEEESATSGRHGR